MFRIVNAIIGAIVWGVANVVYVDLRRKGIHSFTRFAAFWVGTPTTWISLFAVRVRPPETFSVEDDGGEHLMAAIRRDRALRPGERPMDEEVELTEDPLDGDRQGEPQGGGPQDESDAGSGGGGDGWAPLARSRTE
jgi:hypothetical protein